MLRFTTLQCELVVDNEKRNLFTITADEEQKIYTMAKSGDGIRVFDALNGFCISKEHVRAILLYIINKCVPLKTQSEIPVLKRKKTIEQVVPKTIHLNISFPNTPIFFENVQPIDMDTILAFFI